MSTLAELFRGLTVLGRRHIGPARSRLVASQSKTPWDLVADLRDDAVSVVFDVGANVGAVGGLLAERFPRAEIYCFEPVDSTFAILRSRLSDLRRARCFAHGFSDRPRVETIYVQAESAWNSLSKNIDRGLGETEIRLETVDEFCVEHGIVQIDLLKSDTEGHDLEILRGAHGMLSRGRIDCVFVEVGFYRQDTGHTYFCHVLEYLQRHALQFLGLFDQEGVRYIEHEREPCYPWANALFVRDALVRAKYGDTYEHWLAERNFR